MRYGNAFGWRSLGHLEELRNGVLVISQSRDGNAFKYQDNFDRVSPKSIL
jgi:hypothetical protein